jgi:hypothetical protein
MVDDEEWEWIIEHSRGAFDHLVIVSSMPVFLSPGVHYLEAWSEAVCSGAWGGLAARLGEKLRRALDLEHWPAFQRSFERMMQLLRDAADGSDGHDPPASITVVGGDVHNAYVAEVSLGRFEAAPEPRAPGSLLALPKSAWPGGKARGRRDQDQGCRRRHRRACAACRGGPAIRAVALPGGPDVRQLDSSDRAGRAVGGRDDLRAEPDGRLQALSTPGCSPRPATTAQERAEPASR